MNPLPSSAGAGSRGPQAGEELAHTELFSHYSQAFTKASRLPLELVHPEQRHPARVDHADVAFCERLSRHPDACAACMRIQRQLGEKARRGAVTLECPAGLHETAFPVHLRDGGIMLLKTGHLLFEKPTEAGFRNVSDRVGGWKTKSERTRARAAWFKVTVMERSRYEGFIGMLECLARQLESPWGKPPAPGFQGDGSALCRARQFIAEHLREPLTLATVAGSVGLSRQHFCKIFKERVGLSFTDYLSTLRIETACRLLGDPDWRICEVAYQSGFQSISQFNRTFQRHKGVCPSDYRRRACTPGTRPAGKR